MGGTSRGLVTAANQADSPKRSTSRLPVGTPLESHAGYFMIPQLTTQLQWSIVGRSEVPYERHLLSRLYSPHCEQLLDKFYRLYLW